MARFAPAAFVAALLTATVLAFAYTESLKLTPSPILGTLVTKAFSPVCECDTDVAEISFRLRQTDRLDIELIASGGAVVRHLVTKQVYQRGKVTIIWNGRDDSGAIVPDATYRPRVRLEQQRRTIVLPNPIAVDTTPPNVSITRLAPTVFSPDGDGRGERVVIGYRTSEPARVSLLVGATRAVVKKGRKTEGTIEWFGKRKAKPLPRGVYRLRLSATDLVGNVSARSSARVVVIRYVALGRERIVASPGARFAVLVLSDAARVSWKIGTETGRARPGTLRLRAPLEPGEYTLAVTANGRTARAAIVVRSTAP